MAMDKSNKREEFDVNQGHGDHNDCLFSPDADMENGVAGWLPKTSRASKVIAITERPIDCSCGKEAPDMMPIAYVAIEGSPVRLMLVIGILEKGKVSTLVSAYPECEGEEVKVRLTEIHEWANGVEATLEGTVLGEVARDVAFFDTRYALHKGQYEIGGEYTFKMAALAYDVEIMPENERIIKIEGARAAEIRKVMGMEPEFEADGSVKPLEADQSTGVAYWSRTAKYPDDAYFQSPVFTPVGVVQAFDGEFLKMGIGIARDDGGSDAEVRIPLYAHVKRIKQKPSEGDPVRGYIWLQGYRI